MRALIAASLIALSLATVHAVGAPESYWPPYLRGMKEPILPSAKLADGDFQFRWTRLVGQGEPHCTRIWRRNGQYFARSVRLEFRLDYSIGHITRDQTMRLDEKQVAELRNHVTKEGFWRPLNTQEDAFERQLLGGAHWLFEIQEPSGYRFLSMFSPALLAGDPHPPKMPKEMRSFRPYIAVATFLLRTTRIFPDELKPYR